VHAVIDRSRSEVGRFTAHNETTQFAMVATRHSALWACS